MKILHITNAYPTEKYSSFGIFIKEQIDSLNLLGFQNDYYFINAWEKGKKEYFRHILAIKKLAKNYDIVHCHHVYSILPYLLSCSRKPFIVSLLGDINSIKKPADRILFRIALRFSRKVIYKNEIETSNKKMLYMPNGVNLDLFIPKNKDESKKAIGLEVSKKYALFVSANGTQNIVKRYDRFQATLLLLKDRGTEIFPMILAGVKREDVPLYYNASEILILTSDHEGSPNAVKEAMACNIPVVSTDVGNVKRMLEGCNASFVAGSNTVEELSDLVLRSFSIRDNNEREVLISKKLDMRSVALKLSGLYKEILGAE